MRDCLKSATVSRKARKTPDHEVNHGRIEHRLTAGQMVFIILSQASIVSRSSGFPRIDRSLAKGPEMNYG